jgi:hypothetical protein
MIEGFAGIDYFLNMLSDVNLIQKGGLIGLTIVIADLVILSSPIICLRLFENRGILSFFLNIIFCFILTLLFGVLIVGFAVEIKAA